MYDFVYYFSNFNVADFPLFLLGIAIGFILATLLFKFRSILWSIKRLKRQIKYLFRF